MSENTALQRELSDATPVRRASMRLLKTGQAALHAKLVISVRVRPARARRAAPKRMHRLRDDQVALTAALGYIIQRLQLPPVGSVRQDFISLQADKVPA